LKIALWIVQSLLAAAFLLAGFMKTFTPVPELAAQMPWVADVPAWMPRLAGISEILAAFGLILPSLLRIKPWLTPLAAAGLLLIMVLASGLHVMRGEYAMLLSNGLLAGLSAFVAYGRARLSPVPPRVVAGAAGA